MFEIGDVLYSSWGYDQTNIDFYQVVSKTSKTIGLRQLRCNRTYDPQFMSGEIVPVKFSFCAETFRRKLPTSGSYIKISNWEYAKLWDGLPKRYTSYA